MNNKDVFRALSVTAAVGLCALALPARQAQAHYRDFSFSRDWFLPFPGEKEFESRTKWVQKDEELEEELEFEYGVSEHFAIEPGIAFHKEKGTDLKYDGWDAELRFNAGTFKTGKVLPAMNVEYEKRKDESAHVEVKLVASIFSKNGSDLSVNYNFGRSAEHNEGWESEFTAGFVMPLKATESGETDRAEPSYKNGLRGGIEFVHDVQEGHELLGPTLVFRGGKHVNFVATYGFAINHREENHDEIRLIGEYEWE
jgi:hypothetical protein